MTISGFFGDWEPQVDKRGIACSVVTGAATWQYQKNVGALCEMTLKTKKIIHT